MSPVSSSRRIAAPAARLVIGVGRGAPDARRARAAYDEAREAAEIGLRLDPAPRVVAFWDLGVLHWLHGCPSLWCFPTPTVEHVAALDRQDQRNHGELVATLEAFLDHSGALAPASELLGVHRNTLLYRIDKIEQTLRVGPEGCVDPAQSACGRQGLSTASGAFRRGLSAMFPPTAGCQTRSGSDISSA